MIREMRMHSRPVKQLALLALATVANAVKDCTENAARALPAEGFVANDEFTPVSSPVSESQWLLSAARSSASTVFAVTCALQICVSAVRAVREPVLSLMQPCGACSC
jgi:hypothetical protein